MEEAKKNAKKEDTTQGCKEDNNKETYKPSGNPTMDMFKAYAQQGKTTMDRDAMINNHRKNIDAMTDASKTAMDLLKSVTNLQNQYVRQTFEDFNAILRDMIQSQQSPEQLESQALRLKESMSKAIDHTSNIANIVVKTNSEFYKKAQNQVNDSFEEMKFKATKKS
ncbi:MAG: phasin family protein [Pseudomonadota bacterium]